MSNHNYGKLYLIPNYLSTNSESDFLPGMVKRLVHPIKTFVVETEKDARALIKRLELANPQNELTIRVLNEHSSLQEIPDLLQLFEDKTDVGIISDAGLPCVADPGSNLVALAQAKNIEVVALPGASSMMMALMASGFNGQQFTFNGYIVIDKQPRAKKIKQMELDALRGITQLFMETPYRNNALLKEILASCNSQTKLCIACNISDPKGFTQTKTIEQWKQNLPDLHKMPVIFIFGNS